MSFAKSLLSDKSARLMRCNSYRLSKLCAIIMLCIVPVLSYLIKWIAYIASVCKGEGKIGCNPVGILLRSWIPMTYRLSAHPLRKGHF